MTRSSRRSGQYAARDSFRSPEIGASRKALEIINRREDENLSQILCHLGGGCSLAAVRGTQCLVTTIGFTPLDGIAMCTRSGAIDPGILLHLLRHGTDLNSLEQTLNKRSGSLRPFRAPR